MDKNQIDDKEEGQKKEDYVYEVDGHKFKSVDEVLDWGKSLQQTLGTQGKELGDTREELRALKIQQEELMKRAKTENATKSVVDDDFAKQWEEQLMTGDGVNAVKSLVNNVINPLVEEKIKAAKTEVSSAAAQQSANEAAWSKFFAQHSELAPLKEAVRDTAEYVILPKMPGASIDEKFKAVADYFSAGVSEAYKLKYGKDLNDKNTMTESGTSRAAGGFPEQKRVGTSMVEQIKAYQKKKGT